MDPIKFPSPNTSKPTLPTSSPKPASPSLPAVAEELAKDTFKAVEKKLDQLSEVSQGMSFSLQTILSKMTQADSAASTVAKKHSEANDAIIGKIKG